MKFCKDCKYICLAAKGLKFSRCGKSTNAVAPYYRVTGTDDDGELSFCRVMRSDTGDCGPDAKFFDPADEQRSAS